MKLDDQRHEAIEGQYMLPGLDLNNLNRDSSNLEPYSSPGSSCEQEAMPYSLDYGQQGTISPVLWGNDQQTSRGPYLGSQPSFTYDPYAFTANTAYPPLFPQQSIEHYIEYYDQPQSYGGLTFSAFGTSSAGDFLGTPGISSETGYRLFDGGAFISDMTNW